MGPKAREILEQAHALTEDERRELAIQLLDSTIAPETEGAWVYEARHRVVEVASGDVATIPNDEALRLIASDE